MHFLFKILLKFVGNAAALLLLTKIFPDFVIANEPWSLLIVATVSTLLNVFVRPFLKLISFPLILITFGLFNIVLYIAILYLTDAFTTALTIGSPATLFWASILLGILNSFL